MLCKKVLIVAILFLSAFFLLLSGCAKEVQSPKEIPITTSSDEALQLFLKGRDMYDKIKIQQAADFFDQAITLDKNFAMAYLYRAISGGGYKIFRENLAKAVELIDQVSDGEKHQILYTKADADNDGAARKRELDTLLNLYPEDKRVHEWNGIYYHYTVGDYQKAVDHFNKAIELDSNYAPCYNLLGYVDMDLGNFPAAEKAFIKYIELIPDEANPYDSYAEFLLRQGRYDESIEQYNKSLKTDPQFISSLVGLGNNYIFKEAFNKAREYYQQYYDKAFNTNQKLGALYWKAVSFVYENKISDAIKVFDERSKMSFENNFPTAGIGSCRFSAWVLSEKGKIGEAEKYIDMEANMVKTAELNDADRKAFEIYTGLDQCYLQVMKENIKGAEKKLEDLKQTIEKRQEPAEIESLNLVGGLLQFKKGAYNLALENLGKADKESPYVWYWQAMAQEKVGNKREAKTIYSKIANHNVNDLSLALVRDLAKNKM